MQRIMSYLLLGLCLAFLTTSELLATPSDQAENIVFKSVKSDEFRVSFDKGNGTGRIVVIKNSPFSGEEPVSTNGYGTQLDYSASTYDLGNGARVVYRGASNNVRVTGLIPGMTYYAQIFEYDGNYDYNVDPDTDNPNSVTLLPGAPPVVNNATGVTDEDFTFDWATPPGGTPDGYNITIATASNFNNGSILDSATVNGVTNFSATGYSPNTTYYYRVRSYIGGVGVSTWTNGPIFGVTTKPIAPIFTNPTSGVTCLGSAYAITPNAPTPGNGLEEYRFNVYAAVSGGTPLNVHPAPTLYVTPTSTGTTNYYVSTVSNKTGLESATRTMFGVLAVAPTSSANAGPDQTFCLTPDNSGPGAPVSPYPHDVTLDANEPQGGDDGVWYQVSGPDVSAQLSGGGGMANDGTLEISEDGVYVLEWVVTSGTCNPSRDTVVISVHVNNVAEAIDGEPCGQLTTTLDGNEPFGGTATGKWTYTTIAGGGTLSFVDDTEYDTEVTATAPGIYEVTWTITNGGNCGTSSATATLTLDVVPTVANAGVDDGVCGAPMEYTLAGNEPVYGTGTWSQVSGPGTATFASASLYNSGVTVDTYGVYVFEWAIASPFQTCATTTSTVTVTFSETPTVAKIKNTVDNQGVLTLVPVCGDLGIQLDANEALIGVGTWSVVSTPTTTNTITYDLDGDATQDYQDPYFVTDTYGTYVLRWEVKDVNNVCPPTFEEVTITFQEQEPQTYAGADRDICGLSTTLEGVAPQTTNGQGTWTLILPDDPNVVIADLNSNTSLVTVKDYGSYSFEWEVKGDCNTTVDYVTLTFHVDLQGAGWNAGSNQVFCDGTTQSTQLNGSNPADAVFGGGVAGQWVQISGPGVASFTDDALYNTTVTFTATGVYEFGWIGTNLGCQYVAPVTVTVYDAPTVTFADVSQYNVFCSNDDFDYTLTASPAGGSFSGEGVSGLIFNPSDVSAPGTYTLTYTYTLNTCEYTDTKVVTVNEAPKLNWANYLTSICANGGTVDLSSDVTASPSGGTGTFTGTGVNGAGIFNPSGLEGTYTLTYTYTTADLCTDFITNTITVDKQPTITWTATYSYPFCEDDNNVTLIASQDVGQGVFSAADPSFIVNGNEFNLAVAGPGSHTITYTVTNGACQSVEYRTIMVSEKIDVVWNEDYEFCANDNTTYDFALDVSTSGGTYSGDGITGAGVFTPSSAGSGTHTITYTLVNDACSTFVYKDVVVSPQPTITWTANYGPYCDTYGVLALDATQDLGTGTYSTTSPGLNGSDFDLTIAGMGTHTVTYTVVNAGCSVSETRTIVINHEPVVTWTNTYGPVCTDANSFDIGDATNDGDGYGNPVAGVYTGPGVSGTTFDPSAAGPGTHIITYTATSTSCSGIATKAIEVLAAPTITWTPTTTQFCTTSGPVQLEGTATNGAVISYVGAGAYEDNGEWYINPSQLSEDSYYIEMTASIGSCEATEGYTFEIYKQPVVDWTQQLGPYCVTDGNAVTLAATDNVGGIGTYTASGFSLVGNEFTPSSIGVGTYAITYTVTNGVCTDFVTKNFAVYAEPTISWTVAKTEVCSTDVAIELDATAQYATSTSYTGNGLVDNSGTWYFDPAVAGLGVHNIIFTASNDGCTTSQVITFTVVAPAVITWNQTLGTYCVTDNVAIELFASDNLNVGTYSASGNGLNGNKFTPSDAGVGTHTITYSADNGACIVSETKTIEVVNAPVASWTTTYSPVCNSVDTPIVLDADPGVGQGTYTINTAGEAGLDGDEFNPSLVAPGVYTITFTSTLGNCTDVVTKEIEVLLTPTITWVGQKTEFCADESAESMTALAVDADVTGYELDGISISGSMFDPASVTPGTHTVTFYAYKEHLSVGCYVSESMIFTVYEKPVITWTQPLDPMCITESPIPLHASTSVGAGTFSGTNVYEDQGIWYFNPGQGAGTFTITYEAINGTCTTSVSRDVEVYVVPGISWAPNKTTFCTVDSPVTLDGTATNSDNIEFDGTGVSFDGTDYSFDPANAGEGVHTIKMTASNAGCETDMSIVFTVYTQPVITWTTTPVEVCVDANPVLLDAQDNLGNNGTYSASDGVSQDNSGDWYFDPAGLNGEYTVTYTVTNGICTDVATRTYKVNPLPTVTIGTFNPVCEGSTSFDLNAAPAGGNFSGNGASYVSGGVFNPTTAGTYTVVYTYQDANGCENSAETIILVNPLPLVDAGTYANVCEGSNAFILDKGTPAGGWYDGGSEVSNGYFTPSAAGVYTLTYTYTSLGGCTNYATTTITVDALPEISWTPGITEFCEENIGYNLNASIINGVGTGSYSGPGTGVAPGKFNPSVAGPGTHTITFTATNGSCEVVETREFTVYEKPVISWSTTYSPFCESDANGITFAATQTVGTGEYTGPGMSGAHFTPSVAGAGTHTITYTVTNGTCEVTATKTIIVDEFILANAGNNDNAPTGYYTYTLNGNNVSPATGTWALVSGPTGETATFANTHSYNTSVTVSEFGEYTFSWTVNNGSCTSTDEVTIKFSDANAATKIAFVGSPIYSTSGNAFTVTVATFADNNTQVAPDQTVNFTLSIVTGDASFATTVTGSIIPPATSANVSVTVNADDPVVGAIVEWEPIDDDANLASVTSDLYVRAIVPTIQASDLIFDSWSTNQVDVRWENNGNGTGVMLIGRMGASKVAYSESLVGVYPSTTQYGDNAHKITTNVYATYVGSGQSATITNLNSRTRYAFKVIAYNGDGVLRSYNHENNTSNNRSGMSLKSIFDADDLPLVGDNILSSSHITPNPARDYIMLTIDLAQSADLRVAFYSADGKQVMLPVDASNYTEGRHNFNIPVRGLAAGVYSVVITAGNEVIMDNVVIMP